MIRFDGALTGVAKEYFIKKMIKRMSVFLFIMVFSTLPFWICFCVATDTGYAAIYATLVLAPLSSLLFSVFATISKKSKERANIKKVIIKDDKISIISEEISPKRTVKRVKKVCDYGEYYELVFSPFDLLSVCVCQKSLLSKGSIKEFEELFADKLIKKEVKKH